MWFWLMIIVAVVGFIMYCMFDYEVFNVISIVSGVVALIMLIFIICEHTNIEARLEKNREIYNALTYKMESTTCRDEFGFLSKEVIDEVQDWNKDVRYYQSAQDDFWVGIFYANVFDEFKTIDYESYNNG